jgi:hypothetical protein
MAKSEGPRGLLVDESMLHPAASEQAIMAVKKKERFMRGEAVAQLPPKDYPSSRHLALDTSGPKNFQEAMWPQHRQILVVPIEGFPG